MEYVKQEIFKDDEIKFQYRTESELYVMVKDVTYKLYKFNAKNKNGIKIADNRLGSEVYKLIPDHKGD